MEIRLEQFVSRVYGFALRLTGDAHAAEDLTQETLLRAWRKRGQLRDPQQLRTWLFQIAANLWRDRQRRDRRVGLENGQPLPREPTARPSLPWTRLEQREQVAWALQAIDSLPLRQRQVLYLAACEDMPVAEVADVLGTSPESVKASLSQGRKRLREAWRRRTSASRPTDNPPTV